MNWKAHRRWVWSALIPALGLLLYGAIPKNHPVNSASAAGDVPLVRVQFGDVDFNIETTGEVRSASFAPLTAPPVAGGGLQITKLLPAGAAAKKSDIVIEFDPSEQEYLLETNRSELLQAEETIKKAKADAGVQVAEDRVALLKARFDVRQAELEVGKNELVSSIDAQKNQLALEQAKRVLSQLEHDAQSHTQLNQAGIAVAEEKRNKAKLAMTQAQQNMEKMRVKAPIAGIVGLEPNMNSSGGIYWGGMAIPEYRQGDQAQPGSLIARIIDPSSMEVVASISERDRGSIKVGQSAELELDAYPGFKLTGTVKSLSGSANRTLFDTDSASRFDATIAFSKPDPKIRSGMTAKVVILGETRRNVLSVPRQAVIVKEGKRLVFVRSGSGFSSREVKILGANESRAAVEGLAKGDEVALVDPTLAPATNTAQRSGAPAGNVP